MDYDELLEGSEGNVRECLNTTAGLENLTESEEAPDIELFGSSAAGDDELAAGVEGMHGDREIMDTLLFPKIV